MTEFFFLSFNILNVPIQFNIYLVNIYTNMQVPTAILFQKHIYFAVKLIGIKTVPEFFSFVSDFQIILTRLYCISVLFNKIDKILKLDFKFVLFCIYLFLLLTSGHLQFWRFCVFWIEMLNLELEHMRGEPMHPFAYFNSCCKRCLMLRLAIQSDADAFKIRTTLLFIIIAIAFTGLADTGRNVFGSKLRAIRCEPCWINDRLWRKALSKPHLILMLTWYYLQFFLPFPNFYRCQS